MYRCTELVITVQFYRTSHQCADVQNWLSQYRCTELDITVQVYRTSHHCTGVQNRLFISHLGQLGTNLWGGEAEEADTEGRHPVAVKVLPSGRRRNQHSAQCMA